MQLNEFSRAVVEKMDQEGHSEIIGGSQGTIAGCEALFAAVQHLTLIEPQMKILDFGCGCGRLALPMMQFLSDSGSYVGVDIVPRLIAFCENNIGSEYDNCQFYLSGDKNKLYDKFLDSEVRELNLLSNLEQLGEQQFDVIASFSVFTHLTDSEAKQYLGKLKTLLKPNGRIILSCFLINQSTRKYLKAGKSTIPFPDDVFKSKNVYYLDHGGELTAVAYEEGRLQKLAFEAGYEPVVTYHGHWSGRPLRHFYQDIVVLSPSPELPRQFNPQQYLSLNPDIVQPQGMTVKDIAENHYLQYGIVEGRRWN